MYPFESGVWDAIGARIHIFIRKRLDLSDEEVLALRTRLRAQYKTTMRGLNMEFGIDEAESLVIDYCFVAFSERD